jgi:hypothetical protein
MVEKSHGRRGSSLKTVFVSSTCRDIDSLRSTVRSVLDLHFKEIVEAFPQESWDESKAPDKIRAECRKRVTTADAFILILGLWYGWIPPGCNESITHLEFMWARDRWVDASYPRVLVLVPHVGGKTWRELRKQADKYMYDLNPEERQNHQRLIDAFHKEAIGGNRTGQIRRDWQIVVHQYYSRFDNRIGILNWKRRNFCEIQGIHLL